MESRLYLGRETDDFPLFVETPPLFFPSMHIGEYPGIKRRIRMQLILIDIKINL